MSERENPTRPDFFTMPLHDRSVLSWPTVIWYIDSGTTGVDHNRFLIEHKICLAGNFGKCLDLFLEFVFIVSGQDTNLEAYFTHVTAPRIHPWCVQRYLPGSTAISSRADLWGRDKHGRSHARKST